MVLPSDLPPTPSRRVRVIRDRYGRLAQFQDPETGRFIRRDDALKRLNYDPKVGQIVDSFGNPVGVGALRIPEMGITRTFVGLEAEYQRMKVDPHAFKPGTNQEIIERTVFITKEGRMVTQETSYGLGKDYDRSKYGGRWRQGASDALGLGPDERMTTRELRKAVAYQEFVTKTTRPRVPRR